MLAQMMDKPAAHKNLRNPLNMLCTVGTVYAQVVQISEKPGVSFSLWEKVARRAG